MRDEEDSAQVFWAAMGIVALLTLIMTIGIILRSVFIAATP